MPFNETCQTPEDPIQGDLNYFGDWAINSKAHVVGRAAQMGAILTDEWVLELVEVLK